MPLNYPWDLLQRRGDHVFTPGAQANQVARLAKAYVARHLHPDAKVVTITTVEGALTVLAYAPPVSRAKDRESTVPASDLDELTPEKRAEAERYRLAQVERMRAEIRERHEAEKLAEESRSLDADPDDDYED